MSSPRIYVIHENQEWLPPLRAAFERLGVSYTEWALDEHQLDLTEIPPEGVFYSRMSASNFTRDHKHANQASDLVLRWLEAHGRRVINGSAALALEFSKYSQQIALDAAGFITPRTVVAVGDGQRLSSARKLALEPFIVKPNQGGKGFGVAAFERPEDFQNAIDTGQVGESFDQVLLVQERIETDDDFITRLEFVGGRFLYAVEVHGGGSFELCPADVCEVSPDTFCPTNASSGETTLQPSDGLRFEINKNFDSPEIARLEAFLNQQGIEVAGIEFIRNSQREMVIYDINTNTNYNLAAEKNAQLSVGGMEAVAKFLADELCTLTQHNCRQVA